MVTPAELVTLQQQLRQEVADVIQQLRAEVSETISGRMDMMNNISAALQRVTAKSAKFKPYGISDLIPEIGKAAMRRESSEASCQTCTCGCKRGQIKENRSLPWWRVSTDLTTT